MTKSKLDHITVDQGKCQSTKPSERTNVTTRAIVAKLLLVVGMLVVGLSCKKKTAENLVTVLSPQDTVLPIVQSQPSATIDRARSADVSEAVYNTSADFRYIRWRDGIVVYQV